MPTEPAHQIKEFYSSKAILTFHAGDAILLPDTESLPPISYIEQGIIEQYDITKNGERVLVNTLKPGAFFPASSAMNHTPNSFYFAAADEVTVRQASASEVELLLQENPAIVYDLLQRLYRGLDGLLHKLSSSLAEPDHSSDQTK